MKLTSNFARTEKGYSTTRATLQALAKQGRMEDVQFLKALGADPVVRMADLVNNNIVMVVGDDQVEFQSRAARRFAEIMPSDG